MSNFSYLTEEDDLFGQGILTASSEATTYPAANAGLNPVTKPWRTGSVHTATITLDCGYPRSLDTIAVIGHNLSSSATVALLAGTDGNCSDEYNALTYRKGTIWEILGSSISYRFYQVLIDDESCVFEFLQVGRILGGVKTQSTFNFAYNWHITKEHVNLTRITDGGAPHVHSLYNQHRLILPFINRTEAETDTIESLLTTTKRNKKGLLLVPDPSDTEGYYGRILVDPTVITRTYGAQSSSVEFLEDSTGLRIIGDAPFFYVVGDDVSELGITRADTANYTDKDGVLQSAASGVVRDAHYPNPGQRVLLIEGEARTNAVTDPENLDNGGWTETRCSIAAGDETAPDGTANGAHKIVEDGTAASTHFIYQDTGDTESDNTDQPISLYAKADERDHIQLNYLQEDGTSQTIVFDLTNKTVDSNSESLRYMFEELADDWFRVGAVFNSDAGATNPRINIMLHDGSSATYDGDGTSGLYVWGIMHEIDGDWISPGYDSGARTAETAVYWDYTYAPNPLTIYVRFIETGSAYLNSARIIQIGEDDNSDPRLYLIADGDGEYDFYHDNGVVAAVGSTIAALDAVEGNVVEIIACLYEDGSVRIHGKKNNGSTQSGAQSGAAALQSGWSDTKIYLGMVGTTGCVQSQSIKIIPGVHTDFDYLREANIDNYFDLIS